MKGFNPVMLKFVPEEPYCKDARRNNINRSEHEVRFKSYLTTYTVIQPERKEGSDDANGKENANYNLCSFQYHKPQHDTTSFPRTYYELYRTFVVNTAVQYVHKLVSSCSRPPLSSSSTSFSDCYESWQTCPAAVLVGAIYFKTQICSGLYVCACVSVCVRVCMHRVVNTSPDPHRPSSHLTFSGNDRGLRLRSPTVSLMFS